MRALLLASISISVALAPGCYQSHELRGDSGPLPDGGPRIDTGVRVACDEESLPPYGGPACSDAVSACRDRCARDDEPCRDACLDAPCRECVFGTIFHCANESGCEPRWRDFACCVEGAPGCGDLTGFDRVNCATSCPMLFQPYADCIEAMGGMECFLRAARNCHLR